MHAGDTFLIAFRNTRSIEHLWIAVTEPDSSGQIVIVSVTTLRNGIDQTVTLQPGDHPFVNHPSVVYFGDAKIVPQQSLEGWLAASVARPHAPCSLELLALIRAGVSASEHTPGKVIAFCQARRGR